MKVQIRDKEAMESLTIANLRAYLEAHGWGDERPWGTWATVFSKEQRSKTWEVAVPNEAGGLLYAESVAEIITTLAEAEERSQLDVFNDLDNPTAGAEASGNHKGTDQMVNVWCVRTDHGKYTDDLVNGGYVGYGGNWPDFSDAKDLNDIRERLAQTAFQDETSKPKITAYAGMMAAFLWKIQCGDWVITPYGKDAPQSANKGGLRYGQALTGGCWYVPVGSDSCPYTMRRKIAWAEQTLWRDSLSESLQHSIANTSKSVFHVKYRADFLASIGLRDTAPAKT